MTLGIDTPEARVDRVFTALGKMGDSELLAMSGVWTGGDAALRQSAWAKVHATLRRDDGAKLLEESGSLRKNAVPAALDAIVAMLFDDVLDDDEREELLEPLRRVTQPPND